MTITEVIFIDIISLSFIGTAGGLVLSAEIKDDKLRKICNKTWIICAFVLIWSMFIFGWISGNQLIER